MGQASAWTIKKVPAGKRLAQDTARQATGSAQRNLEVLGPAQISRQAPGSAQTFWQAPGLAWVSCTLA